MKIVEESYTISNEDLISISEAHYFGDYSVKLKFNDGSEKIIDFGSFLAKALHPQIRKYLDKEKFKQFSIIDGNLNWNDYDLIFPLEGLYEGKI